MTTTHRRRRLVAALLTTAALGAGTLAGTTPAVAAPGPTDVVRTFLATPGSLGPLADAVDDSVEETCTSATPGVTDIAVPVSGVTTPITDVRVNLGLTHSYLSDLSFVLIAPNGTQATFVDRVSDGQPDSCDYGNDLKGTYSFFDGAGGNLASVAAADTSVDIPAGAYAPVRGNGTTLPLTSPFASLGAAANGTWIIRILDGYESDSGVAYAASITLATTLPRSETTACKNATAAAAAAQSAVAPAQQALAQAKKKLKKAKKSSAPTEVKAKKVKKAKKRVKAAKASLAAAKAAATSTASARTTAC